MNGSHRIIQGKSASLHVHAGIKVTTLSQPQTTGEQTSLETDQLDLKMKNSFLSAQLHLSLTVFPLKGSGYACCSVGQTEAFVLLPLSTPRLTHYDYTALANRAAQIYVQPFNTC